LFPLLSIFICFSPSFHSFLDTATANPFFRECQALWRAVTYGSADANADLKKKLTVQLAEEGSLELASDASDIDEEPERLGATADLYSFAYKRPAVLADADFADKELTKPVRRPAKHQTLTKPEQPP